MQSKPLPASAGAAGAAGANGAAGGGNGGRSPPVSPILGSCWGHYGIIFGSLWGKKTRTEKGLTHILEKEKITTETDRREKEGEKGKTTRTEKGLIHILEKKKITTDTDRRAKEWGGTRQGPKKV